MLLICVEVHINVRNGIEMLPNCVENGKKMLQKCVERLEMIKKCRRNGRIIQIL